MRSVFSAILLSFLLLFAGCSSYNKVTKGKDMDAKFDLAVKLYKKGNYYKALPIFEELIAVYRGTRKAEMTYYYYAYTNFKAGDFTSAAYDFENFVKSYPNSEFTEECAFMQAYCYFMDSPGYSLDQTNTYKAIIQLQLFADRYPSSSKLEECNQLIDRLESKLELKYYETAKMYFFMDEFKAAVTSFRNLLNDFPSTPHREEAMFLVFKAQFRLAENSIEDKKNGRYNEALTFYGEFRSAYPESKYMKEADSIAQEIRKKLNFSDNSTSGINQN
jgi:outer membrane protein assembly factor BamD